MVPRARLLLETLDNHFTVLLVAQALAFLGLAIGIVAHEALTYDKPEHFRFGKMILCGTPTASITARCPSPWQM